MPVSESTLSESMKYSEDWFDSPEEVDDDPSSRAANRMMTLPRMNEWSTTPRGG